jgi:hypothetical protein
VKHGIKISIISNTATTTCHCSVTEEVHVITVPLHKWMDWKMGENIQKVFPELNAAEREMLMTGITPAEWNRMNPDEDYDEE